MRILILFLAFGAVVFGHDAFAQKITEQFKKDMPEMEMLPQEEFEAMTTIYQEAYAKYPALDFSIRIPEGWKESARSQSGDITISNSVLGELKKFFGPASLSERSVLEISVEALDYAMTAEQWMVQHILASGYNLQGLEVYDEKRAEALYVYVYNSVSYVSRAVAVRNGKYVMFAEFVVPAERIAEEKSLQAQTIKTFETLNVVEEFVEEMESYQFLDIAEFKYPNSLAIKTPPIKTIDRMEVQLLRLGEVLDEYGYKQKKLEGEINIQLVSIYAAETLEEEIEKFREDLSKKGLTMGEVIETRDDFLLGEKYDFVDTKVYRATDQKSQVIDYELWLSIISMGEYYFFVSLFTPARDQDYFLWARNSETYNLVTSLIELMPEDSFGVKKQDSEDMPEDNQEE